MSTPTESSAELIVAVPVLTPAPLPVTPSDAQQQPDARKRVRRACDYCRKKRVGIDLTAWEQLG